MHVEELFGCTRGFAPVRVDDVVGKVFRRLGCRRQRLLRVGERLVHEAAAAHVHVDALTGVNHEVGVGVCFLHDRAAVELIHVHEHGAQGGPSG